MKYFAIVFPLFLCQFHLRLKYMLQGLSISFSEADSPSPFSNSATDTSLLNFVAFLVIELVALDRSCSSICFGYYHSLCLR